MKKVTLLIIFFMYTFLPCNAKTFWDKMISKNPETDTAVFIYHIPEEDEQLQETDTVSQEEIITSDDVTADTSRPKNEEEFYDEIDEYQISDMYSDVLYGYADYTDNEEDVISLEDIQEEILQFNIDRPYRINEKRYTDLSQPKYRLTNKYSKYNSPEYSITPLSSKNYRKIGGFSAGTTFDQSIDTGELEQSSGVFSRYEFKCLAINTAYKKTINSTNNNYNDNFYFSPEIRINQYFTLREVFSTDINRNTKKSELILSINPFGNKDMDRLRFELGASQTYSNTNEVLKNQFKFATSFKL